MTVKPPPKTADRLGVQSDEYKKTGNICIYVTLRRVRETIAAFENNKYYILRVCVRVCACVCVCVALVIQHAPYYIVICGLSGSAKLFHIIS
jgi:hypothetical protein